MSKELRIKDDGITIEQVKSKTESNDNIIRVYLSYPTDNFIFQLRAYTGINQFGGGKKRRMIAHTTINLKTMEKILNYMRKEVGRPTYKWLIG